jgi:hypothetical protein
MLLRRTVFQRRAAPLARRVLKCVPTLSGFGLIDIQSASLYMVRGVGSSLFSAASLGEQSKWQNCSAAATF